MLLLDIGLPDMDGCEVATGLRAIEGLDHLKIIAISGYAPDQRGREFSPSLFTRYVVKPVDWPKLERLLAE